MQSQIQVQQTAADKTDDPEVYCLSPAAPVCAESELLLTLDVEHGKKGLESSSAVLGEQEKGSHALGKTVCRENCSKEENTPRGPEPIPSEENSATKLEEKPQQIWSKLGTKPHDSTPLGWLGVPSAPPGRWFTFPPVRRANKRLGKARKG